MPALWNAVFDTAPETPQALQNANKINGFMADYLAYLCRVKILEQIN
jgi:uncharacterized protein YqiB (DUF1249 family)